MGLSLKQATIEYATRLGDDSLVIGHRLSEWCSKAPFLEEDIALSNISLDYLGRTRMLYTYAAECVGGDKTEDDFAYTRDAREFKNLLIYELPRGDFAFTMVRQLFIDIFNNFFLKELVQSSDETLSAIAAKGLKEAQYHLRHSSEWVIKLGDGTEESHKKVQAAVDSLWGYRIELFEIDEVEILLSDEGVGVDTRKLSAPWHDELEKVLAEATIEVPTEEWAVRGGRAGYHTENLGHLLTELQFVNRSMPGQKW